MTGVVISMGDHDNNEASGGLINGTADRDVRRHLVTHDPAVRSVSNPIGLQTAADAIATEDYYLDYEIYTGVFEVFHHRLHVVDRDPELSGALEGLEWRLPHVEPQRTRRTSSSTLIRNVTGHPRQSDQAATV